MQLIFRLVFYPASHILQAREQDQRRRRPSYQKARLIKFDDGHETAFPERQALAQPQAPGSAPAEPQKLLP
jgi:hypothetical protein